MFHTVCSRLLIALFVLSVGLLPVLAQEKSPSAEEALQRLKQGNTRFASDKLTAKDLTATRRAELAKGQKPFAVILACADSRVAPELIFDQGLGELFVVRVAGNVTDPAILGSIEYAVEHLKAPLVVVLGHESCGAVAAALSKEELHGNIAKLIKEVNVGKDLPKDKTAAMATGVKANVLEQSARLTQQSTILKDFVASGRIKIAAGVYSLKAGEVEWLDLTKK
jgi:carbonic anhydrase